MKPCHLIFLVYDVTNRQSFDNLSKWILRLREQKAEKEKERDADDMEPYDAIIIGNKGLLSFSLVLLFVLFLIITLQLTWRTKDKFQRKKGQPLQKKMECVFMKPRQWTDSMFIKHLMSPFLTTSQSFPQILEKKERMEKKSKVTRLLVRKFLSSFSLEKPWILFLILFLLLPPISPCFWFSIDLNSWFFLDSLLSSLILFVSLGFC